jgi:chromosomal replication initiator protein
VRFIEGLFATRASGARSPGSIGRALSAPGRFFRRDLQPADPDALPTASGQDYDRAPPSTADRSRKPAKPRGGRVRSQPPGDPDEDIGAIWRRVCERLRACIPDSTFELWFQPLRPLSRRGSTLYLTGPANARNWVQRRYRDLIGDALRVAAGGGLEEVEFIARADGGAAESGAAPCEAAARVALNPAYIFDRFVIGPGNRVAHGAALAVAEAPGQSYNPLFLHGPPGLGKTHLMGAIASYLDSHSPGLTARYTTAECFTNEFVGALQSSDIEAFKARYRRADVLLIDDVQFLQGKPRTADEFFHTFNALYEAGAQLVLSADRLPAELSALTERLRQRFEWGLIVAVEEPDLPTRLAVLDRLVRERGQAMDQRTRDAIAKRIPANLRALEGAITRVVALSSLTAMPLDEKLVEGAFGADATSPTRSAALDADRIQRCVAEHFGIDRKLILSTSRAATIVRARQVAMYLTRELTDLSLPAIAAAFHRRNHTTVLHATRQVQNQLRSDPRLADTLQSLQQDLTAEVKQDPPSIRS